MGRLPLLIALALATSSVATGAPAPADAELRPPARAATCLGERATLVGTPAGGTLNGTRGRDVVVSNGAVSVNTYSGNDLVCLTGAPHTGRQRVNAGNGNDRVVNLTNAPSTVLLDRGADSFVGGPGPDDVTTSRDDVDRGPDRISTGGGHDSLAGVTSVQRGLVLDGGSGSDSFSMGLRPPNSAKHLSVNSRSGRSTYGTVPFRLAAFERFTLAAPRLSFLGRDVAESLHADTTWLAAELRGGDDRLFLPETVRTRTTLNGGSGDDLLTMFTFGADEIRIPVLGVDLRAGRLTRSGTGRYPVMRIARFNDLVLEADTVNVVGSDTDNSFDLTGCRGSVQGGSGADTITWTARFDLGGYPECDDGDQVTVHGGADDDVLVGGARDDVLIGDEGIDSADGNGGNDLCSAETTVRCEDG